MKKLSLILGILSIFVPSISFAAQTVPWTSTTTSPNGFITPAKINGSDQAIYIASSTATSTIGQNVRIPGNLQVDGSLFAPVQLTTSGNLTVGGKIGVGTSTPSATLAVNTVAGSDAFAVGSSTGEFLIVNKLGQVGIGTTTPYYPLTVKGDAYFASSTSNVAAGIILQDSDRTSTCHRITVNSAGTLAATAVACPNQ